MHRMILPLLVTACQAGPLHDIDPFNGPQALPAAQLAPPDLHLTGPAFLVPGQPATFAVAGPMDPGDEIRFGLGIGGVGPGPCAAALGGQCLGIMPIIKTLGTSLASDGQATLTVTLPAGASTGQTVGLQAVTVRGAGGADSMLSNTLALPVRAPSLACEGPVDWMAFGPYGAGVDLHEGTLRYAGVTLSHLVQVTYPATSDGPDAPVAAGGPFPVVVFEHAYGADYQNYDWLFGRLASHGFVVASVEHDANGWNEVDSDIFRSHAFLLQETVDLLAIWHMSGSSPLGGALDLGRLAFGGHSHGGGGALRALRSYGPVSPFAERDVDAVFLITTRPDLDYAYEDYATTYEGFPALLDIPGGSDEDFTWAMSVAVGEAPTRRRAMVLVEGASHHSFTDQSSDAWASVSRADAQAAGGSAIVAFLANRLLGDPRGFDGFRRDVPLYIGGAPSRMHFRDGDALVLDDFDGGGEVDATLTADSGVTAVELWAVDEPRALYLPTTALEVSWANPVGAVSLSVAAPSLDATPWHAISLRLLAVHADPLNPTGAPLDLSVRLVDADGDSASIALSDSAQGALKPTPAWRVGTGPKSVFESWRLPLDDFSSASADLDLNRLASVDLVFDRSTTGRILVDDVELVPGCRSSSP